MPIEPNMAPESPEIHKHPGLTKKWRVGLAIGGGIILLAGVAAGAVWLMKRPKPVSIPKGDMALAAAVVAGRQLSGDKCEGTGVTSKLSYLPMQLADFSHIEPYGIMIGGHVTPIDHQYFSPANYRSAKDAYPVVAMGDAKITSIEVHPPENGSLGRIRLVFSQSCTFFYYYDLLTSLDPAISPSKLPIDVKAGQSIGRIGGQTLDFAVWDTTKPLTGFVVPEHYVGEGWKIYTADPLDYYTDAVKTQALAKYVRTALPVSGKIDYDVDGKLVGTWFTKGSGGYTRAHITDTPWLDQLSFAPDPFDPTHFVISIGSWVDSSGATNIGQSQAINQFVTPGNAPDPASVSMATGLVKYDLRSYDYLAPDGSRWDNMSLVKNPTLRVKTDVVYGCALVQMTAAREIKFEAVHTTPCASIAGFSAAAKMYER